MKTSLLLFIVFFICFEIAISQEKLQHKHTYYHSPEGELFWNINLPVYISLSGTPDGERIPLKYQGEENVPFYFTVEGINYIRTPWAVDKETQKVVYPKQMVDFPVHVDASPPKVKYQLISDKKFKHQETIYCGKNTHLVIEATDKRSGLKRLLVSINKEPYTDYRDTIFLPDNREYEISFYAVDNVGNHSKEEKIVFTVDTKAPQTELIPENAPLSDRNIFSGESRIVLSATDQHNTPKNTYYSISGEPLKKYTAPINLSQFQTGDYTIVYYSEDQTGNTEEIQKYSFYVDKSPPLVVSRVIGDIYKIDNKTFFSGRTQLQLTGIDNKAGVKEIRYSINNDDFRLYEDRPFYLPATVGKHKIRYYAIDSTGNDSRQTRGQGMYSYELEEFYLDLVGPEINYALQGKYLETDSVLFLGPQSEIVLNAYDRESGAKHKAFSYNDEVKEREYSEPIKPHKLPQGINSIGFYAYDNVNNRNIDELTFFFDSEGPEISIHYGTDPKNYFENLPVFPHYLSIFLSAKDSNTEIYSISYSLNGAAYKPFSGSINGFQKNKKNTIEVQAVDLLGNKTHEVFSFYIQ